MGQVLDDKSQQLKNVVMIGRKILDATLVDERDHIKRCKHEALVFKLDFEEAYNRVGVFRRPREQFQLSPSLLKDIIESISIM